jgi:Uncharacterised protein family (UPF0175)
MFVQVEISSEIGLQIESKWGKLSEKIVEAVALEAYRNGAIGKAQVQELLRFSEPWEAELFLKISQAYLDYTEADLERDLQAIYCTLIE